MKVPAEEKLTAEVLSWVTQNSRNPDMKEPIDGSTDLLAAGILDSVAFVELMLVIEQLSGCKIDLGELDPEVFSTVSGLCRYAIERTHAPNVGG